MSRLAKIVPLIVMSHVHVYVFHVTEPFYCLYRKKARSLNVLRYFPKQFTSLFSLKNAYEDRPNIAPGNDPS